MALTNINGAPDAWEFVKLCRAGGIKPLLGCEVRNGNKFCYILLAKNQEGLCEINRFLSLYKKNGTDFPYRGPDLKDVYAVYALGDIDPSELKDSELIGVKPSEINKLFSVPVNRFPGKFVIRQPVTFQNTRYFTLHRLLRAIDLNTLYTKLTPEDIAGKDETFKTEAELIQAFKSHPAIITRTLQLMDECVIETELNSTSHKSDKNRKTYTGSEEADSNLLRKLAFEGITGRYPRPTKEITDRINKELKVIEAQKFNAYYLIVWDIIRYARLRNFSYVGRGSGANSIVSYLLLITDVDPLKLDLYFERFLNEFRSSPPDFDIDFSHKDRNEIIDYVFTRYGNEHVALLGMYSTFKGRATIRELGKVLGLPKREIDALVMSRKADFSEDSLKEKIKKFGELLHKFPNHHSIHAGGMLISEEPIYRYSAQEMPPKGFATSQLDMFEAENIGLFKLDILSQRGLGHIKDTVELVKQNKGIHVDISRVNDFMGDEKVKAQIRTADTIGCFYIESPAMRQLLLKLRCDEYLTLVAASSIIRPGVAQSGMMKTYIHNYHHPDKVNYLHPKMKDLLEDTYGVMVYQEDVIKVAHHFGGLDMAESDILRRAMSGKYRGPEEMKRLEEKFFANCKQRGYPEHISREVWRQIASFSGYSFSKAHSASFAIESYQSLYLKTYFPMEFMVGVINNFGGFYRTEFYFHELKKTGANVYPPCVNNSFMLTSIKGEDVYVGLIHIEKITDSLKEKILEERNHGLFTNLNDFIERVQPGLEQLNILIRINALRFTGINKKELLWKANFLQKRAKEQPVATALFVAPEEEFLLPELYVSPLDDAIDQIEILGFSLDNLFSLLDVDYQGLILASDLKHFVGREVALVGKLVTTKDSWTYKREHMMFGTFLDIKGDWLDTVHWPSSLEKFPFMGSGYYKVKGKVMDDFEVYTIEVSSMEKVGFKQDT